MIRKENGKKVRGISRHAANVSSWDPKSVRLLKPGSGSSNPVMKALKKRKRIREISERKLSNQMLSNLLWAAYGVNRKKGPFGVSGRTAASASNSQEIDIYVALQDGTYLYNAFRHCLVHVTSEDLRRLAIGKGQTGSGDNAPVRLIYVADVNKLINTSGYREPGLLDPEIQKSYYFVDAGLIAGNVYLFSASRGLAGWFHNCNKPELGEKLKLSSGQRVLFGQTIGYPSRK